MKRSTAALVAIAGAALLYSGIGLKTANAAPSNHTVPGWSQQTQYKVDPEGFKIRTTQIRSYHPETETETTRDEHKIVYNPSNGIPYNTNDMSHIWYNHPTPEVSKRGLNCPGDRWEYNIQGRKGCLIRRPDLAPDVVKYIIKKMKNDPELVVIRYWPGSKKAALLFTPGHETDKGYFERKLERLKQ